MLARRRVRLRVRPQTSQYTGGLRRRWYWDGATVADATRWQPGLPMVRRSRRLCSVPGQLLRRLLAGRRGCCSNPPLRVGWRARPLSWLPRVCSVRTKTVFSAAVPTPVPSQWRGTFNDKRRCWHLRPAALRCVAAHIDHAGQPAAVRDAAQCARATRLPRWADRGKRVAHRIGRACISRDADAR